MYERNERRGKAQPALKSRKQKYPTRCGNRDESKPPHIGTQKDRQPWKESLPIAEWYAPHCW